jgi:phosphoribosylaminoimidazolecarboxamide formyltransferase / IMP cyclohydrolase
MPEQALLPSQLARPQSRPEMNTTCMNEPSSFLTDPPIRVTRALLSVSDKSGLAGLASALAKLGVELLSTGGTREHLEKAGLAVRDIADYTGFPEMMDGRVKTLHPKVFGGILCRRDREDDRDSLESHGILPIDLVVVNLYPFGKTIARPDVTRELAIENIDIGGPSLVRAAAKNSRFVAVVTSPDQYAEVIAELNQGNGTLSQGLRDRLMAAAFAHTAEYDLAISDYFCAASASQTPAASAASENLDQERLLPPVLTLPLRRSRLLRYGENPQQPAALYDLHGDTGTRLSALQQLHGKELSFNNLLDLNAAIQMVSSMDDAGCVVIKHNNPCGAAVGADLADVLERGMAGDPVSAFGSVIAVNREFDTQSAEFLAKGKFFVECLYAPSFHADALQILTTRPKWKANVRLLAGPLADRGAVRLDTRRVLGGMLVQQTEPLGIDKTDWVQAAGEPLDELTLRELEFAWNMVRFVKSNAIVVANGFALAGVGAGQMSRVDSVKIAIEKAGSRVIGSVLASDAFFPFPDSIQLAADAGVRAVIQPGGSVNDKDVIAACVARNLPMILTGRRHFLH